jgi:hypothetical protein
MGRDFQEVWLEYVTGLQGVVQLTVLEARGPCQEEIRRRQGNCMKEFYRQNWFILTPQPFKSRISSRREGTKIVPDEVRRAGVPSDRSSSMGWLGGRNPEKASQPTLAAP